MQELKYLSLKYSPTDIYIGINPTNQEPIYGWLEDIEVNSRDTVDVSKFPPLTKKSINIPIPTNYLHYYIVGFVNPYDYNRNSHSIWDESIESWNSHSLDVFYPTDIFHHFRTTVYFNEYEYPSSDYKPDYIKYTYFGEIPNDIKVIDANFEFVNTEPINFRINTSGDFNVIRSSWAYSSPTVDIDWNVYSSKDVNYYLLPKLPTLFINIYGIDENHFQLTSTAVINHLNVDNYNHMMNILFNSENYWWNSVQNETMSKNKSAPGT